MCGVDVVVVVAARSKKKLWQMGLCESVSDWRDSGSFASRCESRVTFTDSMTRTIWGPRLLLTAGAIKRRDPSGSQNDRLSNDFLTSG